MYNPNYKYTLEEFWKLLETFPDHKYEYIDGAVRMMTGGSLAHAQIGMNIGRVLANELLERECIVYNSDAVLYLSENRCYCPDVSVSCDPADWSRKAMESPTVVVEVLSPSTEQIDKAEKLEAYKRYPTIQEILLVDSRRCYVEHHHRVGSHTWEVSWYDQADASIELASIEVSLALREIYLKVHLEIPI